MIKKLISRKLVSMLVVALFILSFAGIAVSQESQETEAVSQESQETEAVSQESQETEAVSQESQETEVKKMTGMISDIMPDIGQIIVVDKESGNTVTLTAGLDVDLKNFNVGDHVVVEYTSDMVIISINKQTE
jgi:sortase (surface protein transpeptidase)